MVTTTSEVEDHGRGNDGDDTIGGRKPEAALLEQGDHAVGSRQAERAPTGEGDGVDPLDEVLRSERVGLAGAGPAATDIDARSCTSGDRDDGRAGLPADPGPLVVADADSRYVEDRSERCVRHPHSILTASSHGRN
jgi:hypothetical protein